MSKYINGQKILDGVFEAGLVGEPSIRFANSLLDGLYRIGTNNVGLALNGVKSVDFGTTITGFATAQTFSTGVAVTNDAYWFGRENSATNLMAWNVPAGAGFGWATDGTSKLTLNSSALSPATNDGVSLGSGATAFSDLFLATGGVINFGNGNATLTHSAGAITSNVGLYIGSSIVQSTLVYGPTLYHGAGGLRNATASASVLMKGLVASGSGAVSATEIDNLNALATAGDRLLNIKNAGIVVAYIDYLGNHWGGNGTAAIPAYGFVGDAGNGMYLSNPDTLSWSINTSQKMALNTTSLYVDKLTPITSNSSLTIQGRENDAADSVSVIINNDSTTLTMGKLVSVRNNTSEKANVDYLGNWSGRGATYTFPMLEDVADVRSAHSVTATGIVSGHSADGDVNAYIANLVGDNNDTAVWYNAFVAKADKNGGTSNMSVLVVGENFDNILTSESGNFEFYQYSPTLKLAEVEGTEATINFDTEIIAGGAAGNTLGYQMKLDGTLEAGLIAETDGSGSYQDAVWKTPYMTGNYGIAWSSFTPPAPTGLANGSMVIAYNSNGIVLASRMYIYTNGAWTYIDL